jgi:hypothetical protein
LLKKQETSRLGTENFVEKTKHLHKLIYEVLHRQKDILLWGNKQTFTNQKGALNKLENLNFKLKVRIQKTER